MKNLDNQELSSSSNDELHNDKSTSPQNAKERLYDKIPLTLKQVNIIIILLLIIIIGIIVYGILTAN